MNKTLATTAYLILEERERRAPNYDTLAVVRTTRTRPSLKAEQVAIRVNLRVPASVFDEYQPEVTITVPDGAVMLPEPEVEVLEPETDPEP